MSHELRTPLNAVIGFAQLLQESAESMTPHQRQQLQRLLIGADQQVLAIVDRRFGARHHPCPTPEHPSGSEDGYPHARRAGQRDGTGEPCPAAADDRDLVLHARIQDLPASQILRSGVSEVRRSRTRKPSARISSSRLR